MRLHIIITIGGSIVVVLVVVVHIIIVVVTILYLLLYYSIRKLGERFASESVRENRKGNIIGNHVTSRVDACCTGKWQEAYIILL